MMPSLRARNSSTRLGGSPSSSRKMVEGRGSAMSLWKLQWPWSATSSMSSRISSRTRGSYLTICLGANSGSSALRCLLWWGGSTWRGTKGPGVADLDRGGVGGEQLGGLRRAAITSSWREMVSVLRDWTSPGQVDNRGVVSQVPIDGRGGLWPPRGAPGCSGSWRECRSSGLLSQDDGVFGAVHECPAGLVGQLGGPRRAHRWAGSSHRHRRRTGRAPACSSARVPGRARCRPGFASARSVGQAAGAAHSGGHGMGRTPRPSGKLRP